MPKKCIKFIPEYLIPNLNSKRFGERLKWLDETKGIFEIDWRHKAGPKWTEEEAEVFVEWDKHKGHFKPSNKQYYTQSKQRFRALLYKLTREGQLKELPSEIKYKKVFCIGQKKNKRNKTDLNAEYESYEEEISSEVEYESTDDDIHCRKASEDDTVNILEDHSYIPMANLQTMITGNITSDVENEQITCYQDNHCYQDILTTSPELSSDSLQKRILLERNSENVNSWMPAVPNATEIEHLRDGPENTSVALPAGKMSVDSYLPSNQIVLFPENMMSPFTEDNIKFWEFLLDGNYEVKI